MNAPEPRWSRLDWRMPGLSERVLEAVQNILEDAGHGIDVAGAKVLVINLAGYFTYRLLDGSRLSVEYDYDGAPDAKQRLTIYWWHWNWRAGEGL